MHIHIQGFPYWTMGGESPPVENLIRKLFLALEKVRTIKITPH